MIKINFETFNLNNLIYTYLSRRVGMGAYSLVVPDLNKTVGFCQHDQSPICRYFDPENFLTPIHCPGELKVGLNMFLNYLNTLTTKLRTPAF